MANLRQLPTDAQQSIARQIGERLHAALSSAAMVVASEAVAGEDKPADFETLAGIKDPASARFEMVEMLEVWRLRAGAVDEFVLTREDLLTLARPTGAYHHQIKVSTAEQEWEKMAVAFARSSAIGDEPGEPSVRDLFFSPLAAKIDEAILRADDQIPEDAVTRLLSLPEYKIEALWFLTLLEDTESTADGEVRRVRSTVMVISAPPSFTEPKMALLSSTIFMSALVSTRKGMGFLV